jgi:hypothetical protein
MTTGALLAVASLASLTQVSVTSGYVDGLLAPMVLFALGMGPLFLPFTVVTSPASHPMRPAPPPASSRDPKRQSMLCATPWRRNVNVTTSRAGLASARSLPSFLHVTASHGANVAGGRRPASWQQRAAVPSSCPSRPSYRVRASGDSAKAVQPNTLQRHPRACHRNGRSSVILPLLPAHATRASQPQGTAKLEYKLKTAKLQIVVI